MKKKAGKISTVYKEVKHYERFRKVSLAAKFEQKVKIKKKHLILKMLIISFGYLAV